MNEWKTDVAVVGAGVSGLAAAWRLARGGMKCTVFEKSRGLSGRAATRRRDGHRYDHGANFFQLEDPVIADLLRNQLSAEGLVEIPGGIHTFDGAGRVFPGDPVRNAVPKWTYRDGISMLGKKLLEASPGVEVVRPTRIVNLGRDAAGWWVEDEEGGRHGAWKRLVLSLPSPQAAELLRASGIDDALADRLEAVAYHSQFSLILGYDAPPVRERAFHALVNSDGLHPVAWLGFEEDKPGHIAGDASVMVVQMSPDWSADHYAVPPAQWIDEARTHVARLLAVELPPPDWWDCQRWKYAHPLPGMADAPALRAREADGLYLTGDGLLGKGRVPLAMKTGIDAAERMLG